MGFWLILFSALCLKLNAYGIHYGHFCIRQCMLGPVTVSKTHLAIFIAVCGSKRLLFDFYKDVVFKLI